MKPIVSIRGGTEPLEYKYKRFPLLGAFVSSTIEVVIYQCE